jgi:hypothetical protein
MGSRLVASVAGKPSSELLESARLQVLQYLDFYLNEHRPGNAPG